METVAGSEVDTRSEKAGISALRLQRDEGPCGGRGCNPAASTSMREPGSPPAPIFDCCRDAFGVRLGRWSPPAALSSRQHRKACQLQTELSSKSSYRAHRGGLGSGSHRAKPGRSVGCGKGSMSDVSCILPVMCLMKCRCWQRATLDRSNRQCSA